MPRARAYKDYLLQSLKDPKEAIAYLNAALDDDDFSVFLLALRDVIEAKGGITKIAKITHLNRQHLYRVLSEEGNPEFTTLETILDALGFEISIGKKRKAS